MYSITNKFDSGPDLTDQDTKEEIRELVYQKGKFDLNRNVLEEIQNKKFDDAKFKDMGGYSSNPTIRLDHTQDGYVDGVNTFPVKNDLGYDWWVGTGNLIIENPVYAASKAFTVGEWISGL